MKKIMILLLISAIFLTGCTSTSEKLLNVLDGEIITCQESCETDQIFSSYYDLYYKDLIESYELAITPHKYDDVILLSNGEIYAKEDIPRLDSISGNYDIPIVAPYDYLQDVVHEMENYVSMCSISGVCDLQSSAAYSSITGIDYGFDDHSGYYKHHLVNGIGVEFIETYKFNLSEDDLGFEWLVFMKNESNFIYKTFHNQIFREYIYSSNEKYSFKYIDLSTQKTIYYSMEGGNDRFSYYHPESEMLYEMTRVGVELSQYHDMEFVASLIDEDDDASYLCQFSLFSMNGWDAIQKEGTREIPFSKAYLNGIEVFDDFDIQMYALGLRYYVVNARITLSESERSNFEFPDEYTGNITFDQLSSELEKFKDMKKPLDVTGLKSQDILDKVLELLDLFTEKYE